jgi:hypothetical protein
VWVFIDVPSSNWRAASVEQLIAAAGATREVNPTRFPYEKTHRTTIEILNPRLNRVVARNTLDSWVVAALPGGRAAIYETTPDGIPSIRIVQMEMVR